MSRLLFATARGARVQARHRHSLPAEDWMDVYSLHLGNTGFIFRIHPEDEHLRFGPVSSALRDEASQEYRQYGGTFTAPYGSFWLSMADAHEADSADDLTRSLFLLILAEALASEGL